MKFIIILCLISFACRMLRGEKQTLSATVITEPRRTIKGWSFEVITEKQKWTDTLTITVNNRKGKNYKVGNCYVFSY
jgi:hypothetical protein